MIEEVNTVPPTMLAWSSYQKNNISIITLETKQSYVNFKGVQLREGIKIVQHKFKHFIVVSNWSLVKEIPNTKLLFEEVLGGKIELT